MKRLNKLIYLKAELTLTSPMVIGCDSDVATDLSPVKDYDGIPLIPGTLMAGALRDFALRAGSDEKDVNTLFGYTCKTDSLVESFHSKVLIHDCVPLDTVNTVTRDMVSLDEKTKTAKAGSKFDAELIPTGAKFDFRIELTTYEGADPRLAECFLNLMKAMVSEKIRLGTKKRRGWGKFKLENVKCEALDLSESADVKRWMAFSWDSIINDVAALSGAVELSPKHTVWEIPFSIPGALLIRSYQDFGDDDAVMFKENGRAVIPATSFTGCLRKACFDILYYDFKLLDPYPVLDHIFGFVNEQTKSAQTSKLFIEDISLDISKEASYSRNKINRFTGGAEDRALFTTKPVYDSRGMISIEFSSSLEDWAKQLIFCAFLDIGQGIVPIGGETSIGRGILHFETQHIPKPTTGEKALKDYLSDKPIREVAP